MLRCAGGELPAVRRFLPSCVPNLTPGRFACDPPFLAPRFVTSAQRLSRHRHARTRRSAVEQSRTSRIPVLQLHEGRSTPISLRIAWYQQLLEWPELHSLYLRMDKPVRIVHLKEVAIRGMGRYRPRGPRSTTLCYSDVGRWRPRCQSRRLRRRIICLPRRPPRDRELWRSDACPIPSEQSLRAKAEAQGEE